jgi:hypothetical protein
LRKPSCWTKGRLWDTLFASCEKGMSWLLRFLGKRLQADQRRRGRPRRRLYLALDVLEARIVPTENATIHIFPYSGTFDGHPHALTGTATGSHGENLNSLLNLGPAKTDAGHYHAVAWSFAGNAQYAPTSGISTIDLAQAHATLTVNPVDVTYDGRAHSTTGRAYGIAGVDLGPAAIHYSRTTGPNYHTLQPPVDAGLYFAYGYFPGNRNYTYVARTSTIFIHRVSSGGSSNYGGDGSDPALTMNNDGNFLGQEGVSVTSTSGIVNFSDPGGPEDPSEYSATINWGDGQQALGPSLSIRNNMA